MGSPQPSVKLVVPSPKFIQLSTIASGLLSFGEMVIHTRTAPLQYASAGHCSPTLAHASAHVEMPWSRVMQGQIPASQAPPEQRLVVPHPLQA